MPSEKKIAATYEYTLDEVRVSNLNAGCVVKLKWEANRLTHHGHTDAVTVGLDGSARFHVSTVEFASDMKPASGVADEWAPKTVKFTLVEMPKGSDHHVYNQYDEDDAYLDDREPVDELDNHKKKNKKKKKRDNDEDNESNRSMNDEKKRPHSSKQPGLFTRLKEKHGSRKIAECVLQLAYFVDANRKQVVIEMERLKQYKHRNDGSLQPLMVTANPLLCMKVTSAKKETDKKHKKQKKEQKQQQEEPQSEQDKNKA